MRRLVGGKKRGRRVRRLESDRLEVGTEIEEAGVGRERRGGLRRRQREGRKRREIEDAGG